MPHFSRDAMTPEQIARLAKRAAPVRRRRGDPLTPAQAQKKAEMIAKGKGKAK